MNSRYLVSQRNPAASAIDSPSERTSTEKTIKRERSEAWFMFPKGTTGRQGDLDYQGLGNSSLDIDDCASAATAFIESWGIK